MLRGMGGEEREEAAGGGAGGGGGREGPGEMGRDTEERIGEEGALSSSSERREVSFTRRGIGRDE